MEKTFTKMNILLTYNIREFVDVLCRFANEIHVADNGVRNPVIADQKKVFSYQLLNGGMFTKLIAVAQYLFDYKIDIIYAQGIRHLIFYTLARLISRCNCRIIVTSHSSYVWKRSWKPVIILGLTRLLANAFIFLARCHYEKWQTYCKCIGLRSFHIGNPVDVQRFKPKDRTIKNKYWQLGYVGVVNKQKGQDVLIEAANQLKMHGLEFSLHMVGDVNDINYQKELKFLIEKYNLGSTVHFYGRMPYDQIPSFLSSLDIYLCPSLMEMMPFNILEAMATGLPVVATLVGGIPDAIRSGIEGFLVTPGNPTALTEGIIKAMDPGVYAKLSRNSRSRVEAEFSYHAIGTKLQMILEKILQ